MPPPCIIVPPVAAPGADAPIAAMGNSTWAAPAFSNYSVAAAVLPCSRGMFEVEEHQVRARRLEHHRLARLDLKAALRRPRFHDAIFHGHGVDLALGAGVAGDTAKP